MAKKGSKKELPDFPACLVLIKKKRSTKVRPFAQTRLAVEYCEQMLSRGRSAKIINICADPELARANGF